MKNACILLCLCFGVAASAQQFPVDTIQFTGPQSINVVVLSDGYVEAELDQFILDAADFSQALLNRSPFLEYASHFNVFAVRVPSNESGATHPGTATDVNEPAHPVETVDNYFGSSFDFFDIHRLLVATNQPAIFSVLANSFPNYDQVVILANSPYYGGSGGQFAVTSLNQAAAEIAIHEIGHSFANLADEYYAGDFYAAELANMTQETDPAFVRWTNWYGDQGVGIYQHCCGGNSSNWYKPHQDCLMEALGNEFCAVCKETIVERVHDLRPALLDYSPSTLQVEVEEWPQLFRLELVVPEPNTISVDWTLNGETVASQLDSFLLEENQLQAGANSLIAFVEDTTAFLRVDNHSNIHGEIILWTVENDLTNVEVTEVERMGFSAKIFPNPVQEELRVVWQAPEGDCALRIVDAQGRLLQIISVDEQKERSIGVSSWRAGTYWVQFVRNGQILHSQSWVKVE